MIFNKKYIRLILLSTLISVFTSYYTFAQIANPTDINGISAWWCADSVQQETETYVSLWNNIVNAEISVSQPLIENSPKLIKNVEQLNNHSVLRFDGNDYLDGGNILNVGKLGQTAFVVAKSVGANGCFFAKSLAGLGNSRYYCMYENSKPTFLIQFTKDYYGPIGVSRTNNYEQFSTIIDGIQGSMSFFQNMIGMQTKETFQVAYNFVSSFNFLVGAYNNTSGTLPPNTSYYLNGDIAELIFYDRPLSNIERQSVENYLRSKYFPGTEREQFSLGEDVKQQYSLKPVVLSTPERDYFKTYKWSTGETTKNITVQKTGVYDVFVTDDWGYEYVDTISITFPELKYIPSQTICDGESLVWDCGLKGDYSYAWSTGETTQAISITKAGKYAVKVTDNEGYSIVSDTVEIFVDDFSTTAKLGADTAVCEGNRIGLATRVNDAKHYLWSTGDTTATIAIQTGGTYSVAVTNELGCTATDEVKVAIKGVAPIVNYVSQYHCLGETTELLSNSYTTDNTAITNTMWVVGDDTLTGAVQHYVFDTIGSFPFTLFVENEAGCVQSLSSAITIHPVPVAQFSPKISCQFTPNTISSTATIASGKIASYQWNAQGNIATDSLIVFGSDEVGSFPVTLRVTSDFGCSSEITDNVVVRPSSKIEFVHTKSCLGDTVLFFDITDYKPYNPILEGYWLFDGKKYQYRDVISMKLTDTLHHPIALHVKTFNGCVNIASDTIAAHDVPRPVVADTLYACPNAGILLSENGTSADAIQSYQWSINGVESSEKQPVAEFAESGTYSYSVFVTTDADCYNRASGVIVVEDMPQADFSFYPEYGAAPLDVEFTNLSEHAVCYQWTFEESVVTDEEHPSYTFEDKSNSYAKLRASSEHGCADSVTKYIPVQLSDLKLQILDVVATMNKGQIQYTIQILNTGNDNIPEMEISLQSPDFPMLTETWFGALKANDVLNYTFTTKTAAKNGEIPAFLCASASIASTNQNATYYSDEFCKDNSGEFMVYSIAPNPVEKTAQISFNTKQKGTVTIECYDDAGKVRFSQEFTDVTAGFHTIQFDASQLPAGRYTVQIAQGNQKERMAIMKR